MLYVNQETCPNLILHDTGKETSMIDVQMSCYTNLSKSTCMILDWTNSSYFLPTHILYTWKISQQASTLWIMNPWKRRLGNWISYPWCLVEAAGLEISCRRPVQENEMLPTSTGERDAADQYRRKTTPASSCPVQGTKAERSAGETEI